MKIKIVIFDLDGTLIDIKNRYFRVFNDFITLNGSKKKYTVEEYIVDRIKFVSDTEILRRVIGFEEAAVEEFNVFKHNHIEDLKYLEFDTIKPHVKDLLKILKDQGFRVELLTARRNYKNLILQLRNMDLIRYFDNVLMWPRDFYTKREYVQFFYGEPYDTYLIGDSVDDYLAVKDSLAGFYLVNDSIMKNDFTQQEALSIDEIMYRFRIKHF